MRFETRLPCDRLKPYIKYFAISESSDARTYKVLPDTSLVMGFQYDGKLAYLQNDQENALAAAGITGLRDNYRIFKNGAQTSTVLVVFNETGATHFLKDPVNELFSESLSLDNFFDRARITEAREKLSAALNDDERILIVERLLVSQFIEKAEDRLVNAALSRIHQSKGNIRMADLAEQLDTSQSPLEKRFRAVVGATPKKFASIVRFKNVMAALKEKNYQEVVFLSGYYDQAHMIKDFKLFSGTTPEQYLNDESK